MKRSNYLNRKTTYIPAVWAVLLIAQAVITPIHVDEAYYWTFSKYLDWGFFDHPPAVALLIKFSDYFFNGTLGVRFFTIIFHFISVYFIWKTIDRNIRQKENIQNNFWSLIIGLPLMHLYSVITTPDVPLLLSTSIFFFIYKKTTTGNGILYYGCLGISMGLMMLSKYHGALVVICVLLSNPKLFLNIKFYLAAGVALLIWSPHLYWQFQHDWISFKYHLVERADNPKWYHPLEFIGNAILIFNPLFIGLFIQVLRNKWQNVFERSLYFTLFGFILFFAINSLRDHVQPQWLVVTYIPFLILLMNRLELKQVKYIKIAFWISVPLFFGFHLVISKDILPKDLEVFRKKQRVEKIVNDAQGRPIVFVNSYKDASLYAWYNGDLPHHSYNSTTRRKNQYNIWKMDTLLHEKEVYAFGSQFLTGQKWKQIESDGMFATFYSFEKIEIELINILNSLNEKIVLELYNPYNHDLILSNTEVILNMILFKNKKVVGNYQASRIDESALRSKNKVRVKCNFDIPESVDFDAYGFSVEKFPWPARAVKKTYQLK